MMAARRRGFEYILETSNLNGKFNSAQGNLRHMLILMKALDDILVCSPSCKFEASYKAFMEKVVRKVGELKQKASRRDRLSAEIVCRKYMMEQKKVVSFEKIFYSAFVNSIMEAEAEVGRDKTVIWMSMEHMYYCYQQLILHMSRITNPGPSDTTTTTRDTNLLRAMMEVPVEFRLRQMDYDEFESKMKALLFSANATFVFLVSPNASRRPQAKRVHNALRLKKIHHHHHHHNNNNNATKKKPYHHDKPHYDVKRSGGFYWRFVCDLMKAELMRSNESMYGHVYFSDVFLLPLFVGFNLQYDS